MKTTEQIEKFLSNLNTEIDILSCIDIEEIDQENAYNSIYDMLNDRNGFDIEIIYYARAMEYLMKNDPSLTESLGIASEYGFDLSRLNSETLASLLASQNSRDEFAELEDGITDFFESEEEEEN
jgi:hypothetical protein